ncbi:MAG: YceI family protein [Phycisphaerae bacterium]
MHKNTAPFYASASTTSAERSRWRTIRLTPHLDVVIKTESVDTNNKKRDGHLKSPDFFNAREFPTISFKSTKVEKGEKDTLKVTGDLTCHGVTKSITIDVVQTASCKRPTRRKQRHRSHLHDQAKRIRHGVWTGSPR